MSGPMGQDDSSSWLVYGSRFIRSSRPGREGRRRGTGFPLQGSGEDWLEKVWAKCLWASALDTRPASVPILFTSP